MSVLEENTSFIERIEGFALEEKKMATLLSPKSSIIFI